MTTESSVLGKLKRLAYLTTDKPIMHDHNTYLAMAQVCEVLPQVIAALEYLENAEKQIKTLRPIRADSKGFKRGRLETIAKFKTKLEGKGE